MEKKKLVFHNHLTEPKYSENNLIKNSFHGKDKPQTKFIVKNDKNTWNQQHEKAIS